MDQVVYSGFKKRINPVFNGITWHFRLPKQFMYEHAFQIFHVNFL